MAKKLPQIYYGLHFVSGPAEYSGPDDRIYISEETAKSMDATFPGKPVYVGHKPVDLEKIQEADGYVVESFFNKHDGKHWAKFVVVSDAGHDAIEKGWKLSNAYQPIKRGEGGRCHNIEYGSEILEAEYNHLAIVQVPRYEESVILTPEQFKEYNEKKENELKLLKNSKEDISQKKEGFFMFKFFKKEEIANSTDVANATVLLKNGQEVSVSKLVEMANAKNEDAEKEAKEKEEKEAEEKKNQLEKEAKEKEEKENALKKNAEEEAKKKEEEEKAKKEAEEKKNEILNAMENTEKPAILDTSINKFARGQRLYGSNTK